MSYDLGKLEEAVRNSTLPLTAAKEILSLIAEIVPLHSQLALANSVINDLSKELRDYADTHVSMRRFYEYLDRYPGEVNG